jgi:hypothetical protein
MLPEDPSPVAQAVAELARRLVEIEATVVQLSSERDRPRRGGVFLQAGRPYTNIRHVRQLVASVSGDIFWVDRHLGIEVLDVIAEAAVSGRHRSFTLIREGRPEERLTREAVRLRHELAENHIDLDLLYVPADVSDIHDRWIVADEGAWTLPPASAMRRAGELHPSSDSAAARDLAVRLASQAESVFGR